MPVELPADRWVALPLDLPPSDEPAADPTASGALHWAPLRVGGLLERSAAIARWVETHRPAAMVVDVSVEVALLARLLSVPAVVIAQHGRRDDLPHELAYRSASAVAALWPEAAAPTPAGAAGRLRHVGPISRFDDRIDVEHPTTRGEAPAGRRALLLVGRGGHQLTLDAVGQAIEATRQHWHWEIVGGFPELGGRDVDGDELWLALRRADVVVASASNNCIAEVAAARRPLIAVPQPRPFDEQHAHARMLERLGLALVADGWPPPARWAGLLERAAAAGERWSHHHDGRGVDRLAALVLEVAGA